MELELFGHNLLGPAYNSLGSKLLDSIGTPEQSFSELPLTKKIGAIALRVLLLIAYIGATILDFVILLGMTITVIPALRVGRAHLVNLICSLASLVLGFGILFGKNQKVDYGRKLMGKPFTIHEGTQTLGQINRNIQNTLNSGDTVSFNHLLPVLNWQAFRVMTMEQCYQINKSIEDLVKAGANINEVLKKTPDDNAQYTLIHYLSNITGTTFNYNTQFSGIHLLIQTAIRLGADPYKVAKEGSYLLARTNMIEQLLNCSDWDGIPERVQLIRVMVEKGIKFDRPFNAFFRCNESWLNQAVFSKNVLFYAAYLSNSEAVALLVEGGARFACNELERKTLRQLEEIQNNYLQRFNDPHGHMIPSYKPRTERILANLRLVNSLQVDATVEERRWAAAQFLRYDCPETAMKLLSQPDIVPTLDEDRINWSSDLLIAAIDSGDIDSINFILGKYAVTWNDAAANRIEQIDSFQPAKSPDHASGFQILAAINQYKTQVLQSIYAMDVLTKALVENVLPKTLF